MICPEPTVILIREDGAMEVMLGRKRMMIEALIDSALGAVGLLTANTDVFTFWVQQILLPNLPTKSVSVMDNASFHKGIEIRKLACTTNYKLFD
ncbi:hypothetical protein [Holospora undulata]|uniref:Tc1-like transposase DDE domain-containing protein n=1 Tax=Holospora undulata HU1 TaxID=1321371 RepID=A0A061JFU2_9PROT|nr:hypothetical protein [Holospora undulata]ETZ04540.1 hypothetical protein K737_301056 [Holospora undulata HU1]